MLLLAFEYEAAARLLVNYLLSEDVDAEYCFGRSDSDGKAFSHQVVLLDPAKFEKAKKLCQEYIVDPQNPKYQNLAWQSNPVDKLTNNKFGLPSFRVSTIKKSPLTWVVLICCLVVYTLSVVGAFGWVRQNLTIQEFGLLSETGQWWRLLTPAFIHFSEVHLVFNLIWWWHLGHQIELKFGTSSLLVIAFVSAIVSNIGQLLISGPNFGGLSGVVYAIVGFVWWIGWLKPKWGLSLPNPVIGFLLVWLILGYANLLWVSMANTAHTAGLISGCILAWLFVQIGNRNSANNTQS